MRLDVLAPALLAMTVTVAFVGPAAAARAQPSPSPRIDDADPCVFSGLPAVSPSGRRIAYVSCWTDLSDALRACFVLVDARTGTALSEVVLAVRPTGGAGGTSESAVLRHVARANRALAAGRFIPMIAFGGLPLHDGNGHGSAGGLEVKLDPSHRRLRARDVRNGGVEVSVSLPTQSRNPFCCGGGVDDTTSCSLPPEMRRAWTDTAGRFVLAEISSGSGAPDGCEAGPNFVFLRVHELPAPPR